MYYCVVYDYGYGECGVVEEFDNLEDALKELKKQRLLDEDAEITLESAFDESYIYYIYEGSREDFLERCV